MLLLLTSALLALVLVLLLSSRCPCCRCRRYYVVVVVVCWFGCSGFGYRGCVFVCVAWCASVCVSVCVVSVCVGVVCLSPEVHGPRGPEWHFIAGATLVEAAYLAWEESHTNENVKLAMSSGLEDVYFLGERSPDDVLKNLQHVAKSLNLVGSAMPFEKVMVVPRSRALGKVEKGCVYSIGKGTQAQALGGRRCCAWRAGMRRAGGGQGQRRRRRQGQTAW